MAKEHIPNSVDDVFEVMRQYSDKKGFSFTNSKLKYLAESCYLYFESRKWQGVKYWPPLAMKWVLNERGKFNKELISHKRPKLQGKSIRDKIMEQEMGQKDGRS